MTTTAATFDDDRSLRLRVAALEAEIAAVKRQLDQRRDDRETMEGIQRGFKAVDEGRVRPAREAFEEIRKKRNIPSV